MADIQVEKFDNYLSTLKNHLSYVEDDSFSWDDVVGLLIIQLKNTDSLNKDHAESHATQIQLTSERDAADGARKTEDFFPTFTLNSTFKSWRLSIPSRLNNTNIARIKGDTSDIHGWIDDSIQIRRRILNADEKGNGNPTLQICYGEDLMPLRENLNVDDYLVVVKRKSMSIYEAFGVKSSVDLGSGKKMYKSAKAGNDNTTFSFKNITKNDSEEVIAYSNEYQRAAQYAEDYALENGIDVNGSADEVRDTYTNFQQRFAPDKLSSIPDNEICTALFYSAAKTNDSLCYWLEMDKNCKEYMGSISGGFAYKFGLFQKSDTGIWMSGSSSKPEELTDEQAIVRAKEIRDAIVAGAEIIRDSKLESLNDYEKLDDDLNRAMGQYAYRGWIHKYFSMIYPEKLSSYHIDDWQYHVLRAFRIKPSEKFYGRSGQIAMIQRCNKWMYYQLAVVAFEAFGYAKKFIRLGTSDDTGSYADEWRWRNIVGVGWRDTGSLNDFVTDKLNRSALADKLVEKYYQSDTKTASRKAGEIQTFFKVQSQILCDG